MTLARLEKRGYKGQNHPHRLIPFGINLSLSLIFKAGDGLTVRGYFIFTRF